MKILLATDGSESARAAEDLLSRIHWPKPLRLELLHVVNLLRETRWQHEYGHLIDAYLADLKNQGDELIAREAERFAGIDAEVSARSVVGQPADAIIRAAEDGKADLVVVGARGLSRTARFFMGSVSRHVANRAPSSVLVVRPTDLMTRREGHLRVVYAGDGSPPARSALEEIAAVQWGPGVEITALTVIPPPFGRHKSGEEGADPWDQIAAKAASDLEDAAALLRKTGAEVRTETVTDDNPAEQILTSVEQTKADLVVVGDRGWNPVAKVLLGSVSHRVLAHAPCSVWVAR